MSRRLAMVVALALAAHATSVANGYVFDDAKAIVPNATVTGPLSAARILHADFWGRARTDPESVGTWRPLPSITFWLDWHWGGGRPFAFHLVNVLLHALAALALALALRRATGDEQLACIAAGLWALLAVNSEAVASIVGRADLMAAGFGFVTWWLWRRDNIAAAALAYVAACLCKESAIILPAWLAVVEFILVPRGERRGARAWALLVAAGLAYAVGRTLLFAPFSHVQLGLNNNPLLDATRPVRLWTGMRLLVLTLRVMLVPLNLAADYSGFEIRPDRAFAWEPLLGLMALGLLVYTVVRLYRRDPPVAAGIALFLVTWSVVSNVVVLLPTIFAERLLYLPSVGLALVLARGAQRLDQKRRSLGAAVLVPVAVANFALCIAADRMWHDDLALFAATVEVSPKSPRAWLNYAVQLQRVAQADRAETAFRQSLQLGLSAEAFTGLGALLDQTGRPAEAERALLAALKFKPDDRPSTQNAAIFYARHAHYDQAIALLAPYAARHPDDAEIKALLAHIEESRLHNPHTLQAPPPPPSRAPR